MFKLFLLFVLSPFGLHMAKSTFMTSLDRDTANDLDDAVPEWWDEYLLHDAERKSFWTANMMGSQGSKKPVIRKDDYLRYKSGDIIHINVLQRLFGPGVTGENLLRTNEDKFNCEDFNFTVSRIRNAIAWTKDIVREVNFDVRMQGVDGLASWLAMYTDDIIMNEFINGATAPSSIYGGNATTVDTLNDGDELGLDEIDKVKLALGRQGCEMFDSSGGRMYGLLIDEISAYRLRGDTQFIAAQHDAAPRSYTENNLWTGGFATYFGIWNGVCIYVLNSVRSGAVLRGSYIRPECQVYSSYTAAGGTLTVGADTSKDYTKYFPATGKLYIQTDGSGNTAEEVTYSAKTNNAFTISSTSSYNHAADALVTYYEQVSRCIGFGSEAIVFGYGQKPENVDQTDDYGMITGIGVDAVMGAKLVEDSASTVPNAVILNVKAKNPSYTV